MLAPFAPSGAIVAPRLAGLLPPDCLGTSGADDDGNIRTILYASSPRSNFIRLAEALFNSPHVVVKLAF